VSTPPRALPGSASGQDYTGAAPEWSTAAGLERRRDDLAGPRKRIPV